MPQNDLNHIRVNIQLVQTAPQPPPETVPTVPSAVDVLRDVPARRIVQIERSQVRILAGYRSLKNHRLQFVPTTCVALLVALLRSITKAKHYLLTPALLKQLPAIPLPEFSRS